MAPPRESTLAGPVRRLGVSLLVALQIVLQPAFALASMAAAPTDCGAGAGGMSCCGVEMDPAPAPCCCCEDDLEPTGPARDAVERRACDCAAAPVPAPAVPGWTEVANSPSCAGLVADAEIALPGLIRVERFGLRTDAQARDPGPPRSLQVLHRVWRI